MANLLPLFNRLQVERIPHLHLLVVSFEKVTLRLQMAQRGFTFSDAEAPSAEVPVAGDSGSCETGGKQGTGMGKTGICISKIRHVWARYEQEGECMSRMRTCMSKRGQGMGQDGDMYEQEGDRQNQMNRRTQDEDW